jgi:hypothetical protein
MTAPTTAPVPARTGAHLSISFTAEELAVLAADLGHDPRHTGAPLPALWSRRERELALEVAGRSLRSRRVVTEEDGQRRVAYAVAVLVDIVCAPVARVEVYAATATAVRFLVQTDATVRAARAGDLVELTPFATADLPRWLAADAGLGHRPAAAGVPVELTASSYVDIRRGSPPGSLPVALARVLPGAGTSVAVRRRDDRSRIVGGELAWVDDGSGLWSVPTFDQPVAGTGEGAAPVGDGVVRLEPISAQAVLDTLVGYLRESG